VRFPPATHSTDWVAGTNTIHFVVHDGGNVTGLDYWLEIKIPAADECAYLKICKVAGFLVPVGTLFTFSYTTPGGGSGTVTVPAGPAPGGYCKLVPKSTVGPYTITEMIPPGDQVTAITAALPRHIFLPTGIITGTLHPGINEVTYTNQSKRAAKSGYLEICKEVKPGGAVPPPAFVFHVGAQTITVPTGACSPAIQVVAGTVTVTETPSPPYVMVGCSAIPAANLVSCNPTGHTATVIVKPGGVASGTILTITNRLG
jgi:hypothetical protein